MMRYIIFSIIFFCSSQAFAWIIVADFEEGQPGNTAERPIADAFHDTAHDSKIVSSPVFSGTQAGSVSIKKGDQGFSRWGGAFTFPEKLREGQSIWFRVNVYYPQGWTFDCGGCTEGMKFMRIHTADASGKNEGYHSNLITGGKSGGLINVGTEVKGDEFYSNNVDPNNYRNDNRRKLGEPAQRDQWITYEMEIKFHSESNKGIYRVWQNGNLLFEDLKTATLRSPDSKADFIYLYTYWNNGGPADQTSYVDDIVITNEEPANKDEDGNPFIGVGPSSEFVPVTNNGTAGTNNSTQGSNNVTTNNPTTTNNQTTQNTNNETLPGNSETTTNNTTNSQTSMSPNGESSCSSINQAPTLSALFFAFLFVFGRRKLRTHKQGSL